MFWLVIAFCEVGGPQCIVNDRLLYRNEFDCAEAAEAVDFDKRYSRLVDELPVMDTPLILEGRTYCLTPESMRELGIDASQGT